MSFIPFHRGGNGASENPRTLTVNKGRRPRGLRSEPHPLQGTSRPLGRTESLVMQTTILLLLVVTIARANIHLVPLMFQEQPEVFKVYEPIFTTPL